MYSYEDRIRAVKLYIKFGNRTGPSIRQLGYPTDNSLKRWSQEHQQGRDLRAGYPRSRGGTWSHHKSALRCGPLIISIVTTFIVPASLRSTKLNCFFV